MGKDRGEPSIPHGPRLVVHPRPSVLDAHPTLPVSGCWHEGKSEWHPMLPSEILPVRGRYHRAHEFEALPLLDRGVDLHSAHVFRCAHVLGWRGGVCVQSGFPDSDHSVRDAVAPASAQFNGVSCAAPGSCTAVGSESHGAAYAIESDGAWGEVTELPATSGVQLFGVSCSATTDCTAVGTDGVDEPIYATECSVPGDRCRAPRVRWHRTVQRRHCTSATDCIAVGIDIGSGDDGGMPL